MSGKESPVLQERIAQALRDSGDRLADQVRARIPHSPRPVFLYYVAQTFDALDAALAARRLPDPITPAQQLCLHLILEQAGKSPADTDGELDRIRAAVLSHGVHEALAPIGRTGPKSADAYDFVALGDALNAHGMSAFFAPLESGRLVA
ncbi:hypothetical protein [Nocardia sp. NPDC057668]|uniref:hypothetical protein n=1 Tax=Nocardia sp. NPDC057668 TaxID=3346202 RepID=UPI00366C8E4E